MPSTAITPVTLDQILALQFVVAWAGEGQSDPPRLKWWRTDLVDELGGGDLMQRLLPRTHRWASLEAVRRAAFLTDWRARQQARDPDRASSLFFWGFELDEKLSERIRELKWSQVPPEQALPLPLPIGPDQKFDRAAFQSAMQSLGPEVPFTVQPSGRQLSVPRPDDPGERARLLARALLPLTDDYPAPFFRD